MMRYIVPSAGLLVCFLLQGTSYAEKNTVPPGQPFQAVEQTIDAVQSAVGALQGQVEALKAASAGVKVLDANDQTVGTFVGVLGMATGAALVMLNVVERLTVLAVTGNKFGGGANFLFYESTDCTGQAFNFGGGDPSDSFFSTGVVVGSILYLQDYNSVPVTIFHKSTRNASLDRCSSNPFPFSFLGIPFSPVLDLKTLFKPPYKIVPGATTAVRG